MKNIHLVIAVIAALVLCGAGAAWYVFMRPSPVPSTTNVQAPTLPIAIGSSTRGAGYTITKLPGLKSSIPDLNHTTQFAASVPPAIQTALTASILIEQTALKKDSTNAEHWLQLGLLYHEADDFDAAKDVWLFLEQALPNDTTAVGNLGRLYEFDVHDFAAAEHYFKEALSRKPGDVNIYTELYELYRYSYKTDTSAAADILKAGIAKFPDDAHFYLALGDYYLMKGDTAGAKAILTQGLAVARAANDTNTLNGINQDLSKLTAQDLK